MEYYHSTIYIFEYIYFLLVESISFSNLCVYKFKSLFSTFFTSKVKKILRELKSKHKNRSISGNRNFSKK